MIVLNKLVKSLIFKRLIIFGIIIILTIFLGNIVIKNFQQNLKKFQKIDKKEIYKIEFYEKN